MEIFDRRSFKGSYFSVIPVAELSFFDIREHAVSCNEDSIFRPSTIPHIIFVDLKQPCLCCFSAYHPHRSQRGLFGIHSPQSQLFLELDCDMI